MSDIDDAFSDVMDRTDRECEYARRMIRKAWELYEEGKFAEAAYEVRSFPLDVASNTKLELWAKGFLTSMG